MSIDPLIETHNIEHKTNRLPVSYGKLVKFVFFFFPNTDSGKCSQVEDGEEHNVQSFPWLGFSKLASSLEP